MLCLTNQNSKQSDWKCEKEGSVMCILISKKYGASGKRVKIAMFVWVTEGIMEKLGIEGCKHAKSFSRDPQHP
jgi:hypothetical protein